MDSKTLFKQSVCIFSDDDFYVNIQNILQFSYHNVINNAMYGHQQLYSRPIRNQRSKWYISEEQYPFDMFPTFLSGGAILTHISYSRDNSIEDT